MRTLFFLCIAMTLFDVFLLVYAWTLPMFPKEWRDRVNRSPRSLNPSTNNDSLTGMLLILVTALTCCCSAVLFYVDIMVPGLTIPS